MTSFYEEGTEYYIPAFTDTLDLITIDYERDEIKEASDYPIIIDLQQHLDLSVRLSDNVWFTSRFGMYGRLLYPFRYVTGQMNAGIRYFW